MRRKSVLITETEDADLVGITLGTRENVNGRERAVDEGSFGSPGPGARPGVIMTESAPECAGAENVSAVSQAGGSFSRE